MLVAPPFSPGYDMATGWQAICSVVMTSSRKQVFHNGQISSFKMCLQDVSHV